MEARKATVAVGAALFLGISVASAAEDPRPESPWVARTESGELVDRHGNRCVPHGEGRYDCVTPEGHRWTMETDPCLRGGPLVRRILRAIVITRDGHECD